MAVNCSVRPFATVGLVGLTAIDTSAAAVTVSVSLGLVIPLSEAVMAVVPVARVEARPLADDRRDRGRRRRPGHLAGEVAVEPSV